MMKIKKKTIRLIVKIIKVLIANLWVLKKTILINKTAEIAISRAYDANSGKMRIIIIVRAWAEKEQVAMLAIHRKKPIIKAENPPIPSLLKLYAPPDIGKLVDNSE